MHNRVFSRKWHTLKYWSVLLLFPWAHITRYITTLHIDMFLLLMPSDFANAKYCKRKKHVYHISCFKVRKYFTYRFWPTHIDFEKIHEILIVSYQVWASASQYHAMCLLTNKLWIGKERRIQKAINTSTTGFGSCILILERYTESWSWWAF
jgi:hypothetical protein